MHRNQGFLDLRSYPFDLQSDLEAQVELLLDRFLRPYLQSKNFRGTAVILVGRGLNSQRYIQGKNPLRYYTEQYLLRLGLSFANASVNQGGEGAIKVSFY
ncbi:MAG: hypothetical protein OHK0017_06190 [Patescibacteria group bacterium]